jgi:DNA invertase Pin-like site-specific DNA recombinase
LNEVRAGKIPKGTALIIENLDRLSRQGIDKTTDLLKALMQAGIDIHVIGIQRVLKAGFNNSLVDYMLIGVQADLAHQESQKKSERIGAAWAAKKRAAVATGKLYTSRLPAWLEIRDGKIVEVQEPSGNGKGQKIPADVVREIFRLSALGLGSHAICHQLREMNLSRSWVVQVLSHRSVLGEIKMVSSGEVVPGYFPQT